MKHSQWKLLIIFLCIVAGWHICLRIFSTHCQQTDNWSPAVTAWRGEAGVTRVWVLCLLSSLPPHCLPPLHTSSLHCRTFVRGRMTSVGGCNMFFFWQGVVFSLGKNENNEIINHCMDRKFYICSLLSCIVWFVCEKWPHKVPKCSAM